MSTYTILNCGFFTSYLTQKSIYLKVLIQYIDTGAYFFGPLLEMSEVWTRVNNY